MSEFTNGYDNEQMRQRMANLGMRGAQIAAEKSGVKFELEPHTKAKGSRKQLIGTIVGVAAALLVLVLLAVFHVI